MHPGQVLRSHLQSIGKGPRQLALDLGVPKSSLCNIIKSGRYRFPEWLCIDLERLGIMDRYYWADLCRDYEVRKVEDRWSETMQKWKLTPAPEPKPTSVATPAPYLTRSPPPADNRSFYDRLNNPSR